MTNILKMFDTVSSSEEGSWLHLCVPGSDEKAYADGDKQKKPLRIKLKGPDSDVFAVIARKGKFESDKRQAKFQKTGMVEKPKTVAESALEDAELAAKMTMGFENIPEGKPDDVNSMIAMYLEYKNLREQAIDFAVSRANFTKAPQEG